MMAMDTLQFESIALPTTTPQDTEAHHKFKNNDNFKNIGLLIYVANKTIVLYNNCTYIYIYIQQFVNDLSIYSI